MRRDTLLHLYLYLTVARINVIKQFLSGLTGVGFYFVVKILRDMGEFLRTKAKIVESCKLIFGVYLSDKCFEFCRIPEQNGSEIKIVA